MPRMYRNKNKLVQTQTFNIDNGAAATIDDVLLNSGTRGVYIQRIYALYQEAAGTVAGANFKVGVAAGGATVCAATAYTNSAAIGDVTEATVLLDLIPPSTSLWVRHTGIAATATGTAKIMVEYSFAE